LAELLADAEKGSTFYRRVYSEMVQDGAFSGSFDEFIKGLPSALRKHHSAYRSLSREEVVRRDMSTLDVVSSKLRVLCLSKPGDNIPMWAYYANDHRGVVIGIDISNIGGRLPGLSGFVKYRKHRVRHNPFAADSPQQRLRTIFTKSRAWRHERDFNRVVYGKSVG
jgi:hypothetical protein